MSVETYISLDRGWRNLLGGYASRFPNQHNTGWKAAGATLTPYIGTHFYNGVTTTIDSQRLNLQALFIVNGSHLTITRCEINGFVDVDLSSSLIIEDCNINAGNLSNPAIGYYNMEIRRCDITGGQHSVMGTNLLVEDNYLHAQYNDPNSPDGYHNNAYISNGGNDVILRHNTLDCSTELTPNGGGPTGAASIFGDFESLDNYLFDNNFVMYTTGSYGLSLGWNPTKPYGNNPTNIVVTNNVFERGPTGHNALYGPATSFKPDGVGNIWTNNRYEDGAPVVSN